MESGLICVDCAAWHANRDSSGASAEWVAERLPNISDEWIIEDYEPEFSTWPCESCGDLRAGDRYSAFKAE